ncbi:MAG TPA: hypothetical protein VMV21_15480, partial [Vicinamibacteria bacterium]|nr:hypothetical protein [Vicinamibacteria bacterium]
LRASRATLRLRPTALRGQISLRELVAQGVVLDLVRDGDGNWNLPEASKPAVPAAPFDLRPLLLARIALSDVDLHVRAAGALDVDATGLGIDWSGDEGRGTLSARDEIAWRTADRQGRLTASPATVTADAQTLTLAGPRLAGPEGEVSLTTTLGLIGANAPLAIDAEGRFHLRPLLGPAAPSVEGHVPWSARVRGTLTSPALEVDLRSEGLSVATLHMETAGQIRVADDRVTIEGQVKDGTLPLGGRLFGTLKAHWPLARPREIEATVDTRVEPSSGPTPSQDPAWRGQAQLRLASEHYVLTLDHRLGESARLLGRAEGRVDLMQPLASPLGGTLQIDVTAPAAILGLLVDRSSSSPPPRWSALQGHFVGELGLQGTVGEPVARGRLSAAGLAGQGLPPLDVTAQVRVAVSQAELESLEVQGPSATLRGEARVPFDGRPLKGHFQGRFEDLRAWSSALPSAWAPSGQLAFEASIAGSLARPEFEATIDGSGVGLLDQPTLQRVQGRLRGSADAVRLEALSLEQAKGRLEIAGHFEPGGRAYSLRASAEDFAFGPLPPGAATEQALPVRGQLQGKVEWGVTEGEAKGGGRFELRDFSWEERSLGTASLEVARDETRPRGFSAELRLDGADLRAFARAAGAADDRISGTTTLAVRLRGDATSPAQGTRELDLERLECTAFDLPLKLRGPAHLVAETGRASVRGLELDLAGGRLTADGALGSSGDEELRAEWRG